MSLHYRPALPDVRDAFPAEALFVCGQCLGPLEVTYDYDAIRDAVTRDEVSARPKNLWRYRELLPVEGEPRTGFHSGFTPLVKADRLAQATRRPRAVHQGRLGQPPDVLVQGSRRVGGGHARRRAGVRRVRAARRPATSPTAWRRTRRASGSTCYVFIPDNLEPAKVMGSAIYRPHVVAVEGNYDDINRLCTQIADSHGWGFANINLRTYYAEGAKTYGFEIAEQLGWRFPRHVVCRSPAARCCRASAARFEELQTLGWVDGEMPRIHAVQAAGSAPVVRAFEQGLDFPEPVKPNTIAKSIAIGNPADGYHVLETLRATGGSAAMVDRRGDPRRDPAAGRDRRHLHGAGRRRDARRRDRADREAARSRATSPSSCASPGNGYKTSDVMARPDREGGPHRPRVSEFERYLERHPAPVATQEA